MRVLSLREMRRQMMTGAPLALALLAAVMTAWVPARAQEMVIKEVGRAHLAPQPHSDSPGRVRWSLARTGTRTSNVTCAIETEFTNSTSELLFRLTDSGGLSGDPACELSLRFEPLKNSYTFHSASISTLHCGNPQCKATVAFTGSEGVQSLSVRVRGDMKGVLSMFPARKAIFKVRVRVRGPAGEDPFVD